MCPYYYSTLTEEKLAALAEKKRVFDIVINKIINEWESEPLEPFQLYNSVTFELEQLEYEYHIFDIQEIVTEVFLRIIRSVD